MSRVHSYIASAIKVIETYDAGKPLSYHIKTFFSAEKKYGSRDRKTISALCYAFFRLGHAAKNLSVEERILAGLFLTENKSNEILSLLRPEWNQPLLLPVSDKLSLLNIVSEDIFPFGDETGEGIVKNLFDLSFLFQPDLYLRIRPKKDKQVIDKLTRSFIPFIRINEDCLQLLNNTSLDAVLQVDREVIVQDYNSQQVLNFLKINTALFAADKKITAWDCCAASGGKAILLYDILKGNVKLTVSDIRENILLNLEKRLQQAGISIYKKFAADLALKKGFASPEHFQIIICDVPCTGSGTWSRTPEQLFYFDKNQISIYAARQKAIVSNAIAHLQKSGLFFYITCSVFKKENEDIVAFIKEKFHLQLLQMEYLKGYEIKADTMFVAVFQQEQ